MRELKPHEAALNEAYNQVMQEQGSPIASRLMNLAYTEGQKVFKEKSQACKKHMGFVKAFKQVERLRLMACVGRARAAGSRRAASLIEKSMSKCGKEKHCRESLKIYMKKLRDYASHEESLSAGDEAKLQSLNATLRRKKK